MTITDVVRERIAETFKHRCCYCQMPAKYIYAPMQIDHIIPVALGGTDDETNLCYACPRCNSFKGVQVSAIDPDSEETGQLFNPRQQNWSEHFRWSDDGTTIIGQSGCGRATVLALQMNIAVAVEFRRILVSAGWHPPKSES